MNSHYQQSQSFEAVQSDTITPDEIYQTLIRQTPNLYPLCKFKTKGTTKHLFPDAAKYPDFFNYNLVSPGRVIKKLQGPESLIKGFYYQLMKLAFQIEIQDKDYIEVMRNVIFSPEFMLEENPSSPSSGKNYSDLQYKKIVAEFMEILMHQSIPNFELTILSYPIVDEAMVKIMQNLLKFKSPFQIPFNPSTPSFEILTHLSELFQVTVQQFGNCFKFQQSDIFFYEHSKNEYYIAFLNEMAEMSDVSESSRKKDSSYEPLSSRKVVQYDDQDDQKDYSEQNARRTHEYISSQFEIQSSMKQQQRQSSSQLIESKARSDAKNDKNYRNTVGYNETRTNEEKDQQTQDLNPPDNKEKTGEFVFDTNRQSRESLINELHKLVHQTNQNNAYQNSYPTHEYDHTKKTIQIPHVPLAKSIAEPARSSFKNEFTNQKLYQAETQKSIKEPVKYEYQPKGYTKKTGSQESTKLMVNSAQSDEVIGYSDFSYGESKNIINLNAPSKNYPSQSSLSNFQLKTKQYTVKEPKKIEYLGLDEGRSNMFTFSNLGAKLSSFGLDQKNIQSPSSQNMTRFSQQMPFISNTKNTFETNIQTQNTEKINDIFYSPKPIISKPTFVQQSNPYKSPKNDQTLGTLYKQFTDTKVLDILPQQMQNKIRRMRRKYKGIHAKDFFGIDRF